MKKLLLLIVMSLLLLAACTFDFNLGSDADDKDNIGKTEDVVKDKKTEDSGAEDPVDEAGDEAESDSAEVVIEIPSDMFEGMSEEEIVGYFEMDGIEDVTVNDDGSFTLKMTQEQQQSLLDGFMDDAVNEIGELVGMMGPEFIVEAKPNDMLTELHVMIDMDTYDGDMEGFVLDDFSLYGMNYQLYAGVPVEGITFDIVYFDAVTGEEFERYSVGDE